MGLRHVVITSVDRDDLPNGGAEAFAGCVTEIRTRLRDHGRSADSGFQGILKALEIVMHARPDILNHNLETVERLYRAGSPRGPYDRALDLLLRARHMVPDGLTKSGMILGLGEEWDELLVAMRDLRRSDVDILTRGPVPPPSDAHLPVARFYTPAEFDELGTIGRAMGFGHVQASPLTRSSYHAWEQAKAALPGAPCVDDARPGEPPDGHLDSSRARQRRHRQPRSCIASTSARCSSCAVRGEGR